MDSRQWKEVGIVAAAVVGGCVAILALHSHRRKREWNHRMRQLAYHPKGPQGLGFTDMTQFNVEQHLLAVDGEFPHWIEGALYRGGPAVWSITKDDGETYHFPHWFDGLPVMNCFVIHNGRVSYSRRDTSAPIRSYIAKYGPNIMEFGEDICHSLFSRISSVFTLSLPRPLDPEHGTFLSNVNVTVKKIKGNLYNCTDAVPVQEFHPVTLHPSPNQTLADVAGEPVALKGELSAAHAHFDPHTREYLNFVYDFSAQKYTVFSISEGKQGETRVIGSFSGRPAYIHSSALTQTYFILMLWPATINPLKMLWTQSLAGAMEWKQEWNTEIYVINRHTGEMAATYSTDPFFCFHTINSFEIPENSEIHIHLIQYPNIDIINGLYLEKLRSGEGASLGKVHRIILPDPKVGNISQFQKVEISPISHVLVELPRINPRHYTLPFRYVYCVGQEHVPFDCITKLDVRTGESIHWSGQEVYYPGEPIFIPAPEASSEDEGVLLSIVLDSVHGNSFLLCLDAITLKERGRATCEDHIAFGFHGNFFGEPMSSDVS